MNFCKISLTEAERMPVVFRHWWIDRINRLNEEKKKGASGSSGHVDPFGRHHS